MVQDKMGEVLKEWGCEELEEIFFAHNISYDDLWKLPLREIEKCIPCKYLRQKFSYKFVKHLRVPIPTKGLKRKIEEADDEDEDDTERNRPVLKKRRTIHIFRNGYQNRSIELLLFTNSVK